MKKTAFRAVFYFDEMPQARLKAWRQNKKQDAIAACFLHCDSTASKCGSAELIRRTNPLKHPPGICRARDLNNKKQDAVAASFLHCWENRTGYKSAPTALHGIVREHPIDFSLRIEEHHLNGHFVHY